MTVSATPTTVGHANVVHSAAVTHRPNFLVIGAYKAGTTSLYHYLRQHPQIFLPVIKEVRFLTYAGHGQQPLTPWELRASPWPVTALAEYERLFAAAQPHHVARGEISPSYMAFPEQSILGIQHYTPQAKIIAILRQPAERAYSSFVNLVKIGREEILNFQETLRLESCHVPRRSDGSPRRNRCEGFYFAQLSPYYRTFGADRILVLLYEEWRKDPLQMLQKIFRFLEVDPTFTPDLTRRYNQSAWPRHQRFHQWLHAPPTARFHWLPAPWPQRLSARLNRLNLTTPPPLDAKVRQELTRLYREDILQLQALIGKDLSHWLAG
jgi:hypothetical protein